MSDYGIEPTVEAQTTLQSAFSSQGEAITYQAKVPPIDLELALSIWTRHPRKFFIFSDPSKSALQKVTQVTLL